MKPKPPTEAEVADRIADTIRWNARYTGLDTDGAEERGRQLAARKKGPAFVPAPPYVPPKRKS